MLDRHKLMLIASAGRMTSPLTVVGMGASAGGLDAFQSFFAGMPADCGMAFVVILHLPADRRSMLADILRRWTSMTVVEAADGVPIAPNHVYVPPPHTLVTLAHGCLRISAPPRDEGRLFRPIDQFFDSLGAALGDRAVGIILSGTGSDGALGVKVIHECGGLTVAQARDGSAPEHGEMPAGAIATGSVDLIAPVELIPAHLLRMRGDSSAPLDAPDHAGRLEAARLAICAILRTRLGHDFSGYRDKTFLRRVERRMQVVNVADLSAYIARLRVDDAEASLLFRDLLIRVTTFFRDKETFESLESNVIPQLFAGKHADERVRVWVPGCATREEAYSLAMLLCEFKDSLKGAPKIQVFATDIDDSAIATARLGRYPATLLETLSPRRRERFFTPSQGGFVVSKEIRDLCIFSAHNLVRDPPFSRMDMVSCRNLLIYMDSDLQSMVLPVFHYALVRGGTLLLGGSESAARHEDLFEPLDKAARIFRRRDVRGRDLRLRVDRPSLPASSPSRTGAAAPSGEAGARGAAVPPLLRPPQQPRPESPAGAAGGAERPRRWDRLRRLFPGNGRMTALAQQLHESQERLQSLSEEHQTALEELRSSNEELHSVNEEMQSTNEELETSKEELQSVNEELHTVNGRLSEKVDELDAANSDLRNLFESTQIATIFLDRDLRIRGFTPAIATLYNLIPSDQGRPLTDIVSRLQYDGLRNDVAAVLHTLQPLERRVARDDSSAHYMMRVLPYRAPDNTVTGALVTFVDVTSVVQAEAALLAADERKDVFLATLSHELRGPLAPIRTAARLLESADLQPDQMAHARSIISREVSHMNSLLDDLREVSRITRGAFLLRPERVDVETLMAAAVEAVQPVIDAKHQTLRLERPATRILLDADPVRLVQVLSSLLTNAAQYTMSGGLITLAGRLEPHDVVLSVRDNGAGMTPETVSSILGKGERGTAPGNRTPPRLGIGLALAQGLVELHGGRLEARSAGLGAGSEFLVHLPLSLPDPRQMPVPAGS